MSDATAAPAMERLRVGIMATLARRGCDWAPFAAAVAVARGARALDPTAFGAALGVDAWAVFALERGLVHPALAPQALVRVAPEFDWAVLGVPLPAAADAPPRERHPAARRPARIRVRGP